MSLFIEESLRKPVIDMAIKYRPRFKPNGPGRAYYSFAKGMAPPCVQAIKSMVEEFYGVQDAPQEPMFKDLIGFITEGGAVHEHSYPNVGDLVHTRFNVLLSKPESGGEPVISGKIIQVEEGDTWRCNAGLEKHSCTKVVGSKPRIVLSFGYLL